MTSLSPDHAWLDAHAADLVRLARASVRPDGGFGWLRDDGTLDPDQPVHAWITCRMTHVFALAAMRGDPDAAPLAAHGVAALTGMFHDREHDGWFSAVRPDGRPADDEKAAYPHAFLVLAASTATGAGVAGADDLLGHALRVVGARFWDDDAGRTIESWSRDWSTCEDYRGANSSMHMVEAFLAAADATGDDRWAARALRICAHLAHDVAGRNGWRLPEHFDSGWGPLLEYNADRPTDQFRPYGSTIGHHFEWARLLLHVESALPDPPDWLLADARRLFDSAMRRGWAVDGADGPVYTVGWDDRPVIRARMHWVVAEAIAAAAVLAARTGEAAYARRYEAFWDYARRYLIDGPHGGWRHELGPDNRPAATVWRGRPDTYHAYQATLLPALPIRPSVAGAVRAAGGAG